MSNRNKIIRCAALADMKAIARVHKQIFADHLLGRLPVWLIRQYYTCLFKAGAIAIVAERDTDGIIGFILGGNGRSLAVGKRDFLKRWGALFGGCIMMDRVALRLFWETYVRLKKATSPQSVVGTSFSMRLLSIGVCKQSQGSGIASELLAYFENILQRDFQVKGYGLSVHSDNVRAIRFYQKSGFYEEFVAGRSTYLGKLFL